MKPKLSIIYPYRNRDTERVERSLNSLFRQQCSAWSEIILIDYGSNEACQLQMQSLLKKFPAVRYIYNHTQGMPWSRSHALNTGIKLAEAEYVFTADADMIFDSRFSTVMEKLIGSNDAFFFLVGYLPEKFNFTKPITQKDYQKSRSYALGLALISKNALIKIGGYDEFYCFWGVEDNDIYSRLLSSGYSCRYYETDVLLYHQWHAPANADLPEGWRTCMGEYFAAMKAEPVRNKKREWGKLFTLQERTAWMALHQTRSSADEIVCRKKYFEWLLIRKLADALCGQTITGKFVDAFSEKYIRARPGQLATVLKKTFDVLRIPIDVRTAYTDQFMTAEQARDSFFYFTLFNSQQLADYAFRFNEIGQFEYAFTKN